MENENENQQPECEWDYSKRRKYYSEKLSEIFQMGYPLYMIDTKIKQIQDISNAYTKSVSDANAYMDNSYQSNYLDEFFIILVKEVKRRGVATEQGIQEVFLDILQHTDECDNHHERRYKGMVERWMHVSSLHEFTMEKDCVGPVCNHISPVGEDDIENWDWDHRDRHGKSVQVFYQSIFNNVRLCKRCYDRYPKWDSHNKIETALDNKSCSSDEYDTEEESEERDYPFNDYSLLPVIFTKEQYDPKWNIHEIYPDIMKDVTDLFTKEQRMQEAEREIPSLSAEVESLGLASFTRIPFIKKKGFIGCGYGYHNVRKNIIKDIQRDFRNGGRLKKNGLYNYDIVPKVTHDRCFHVNIYEIEQNK